MSVQELRERCVLNTEWRVLTLTQPWASLCFGAEALVSKPAKSVETRSWSTAFRGPMAIHAAKGWGTYEQEFARGLWHEGIMKLAPEELPLGAIIGVVNVVAIVSTNKPEFLARLSEQEKRFGDYRPNRFGWMLRDAYRLAAPVPARGMQGLWTWGGRLG